MERLALENDRLFNYNYSIEHKDNAGARITRRKT
jgi:hypothetical protein